MSNPSNRPGPNAELPEASAWIPQVLDALGLGVVVLDGAGAVVLSNARASAQTTAAGVDSPKLLTNKAGEGAGFVVERRPLRGTAGFELILLRATDAASRGEAALARVLALEAALRELSVVSHQINNPITALLGRSQMLRAKTHTDPMVEKSVLVIDESAGRIAELAKEFSKLLKEARRDSPESALVPERREPAGVTR